MKRYVVPTPYLADDLQPSAPGPEQYFGSAWDGCWQSADGPECLPGNTDVGLLD